ncbi:hypothetical protein V6C32_05495 [Desulforamulus ruminis]|uniref:hypothetical protein n=1 Tax=Desulforamulus ruminis TaxID=1564 RepID=UPI002FD9B5C5
MRNIFLLVLTVTIIFGGCADQESNLSNDKQKYQKQSASTLLKGDKNWDVTIKLYWDLHEVIGVVEPIYKGEKPIDYVIIEPNFTKGKWPQGYIPISFGTYTWKAETTHGLIPDIYDTSIRRSRSTLHPTKIMSLAEAQKILEETQINLKWKVNGGEVLQYIYK